MKMLKLCVVVAAWVGIFQILNGPLKKKYEIVAAFDAENQIKSTDFMLTSLSVA